MHKLITGMIAASTLAVACLAGAPADARPWHHHHHHYWMHHHHWHRHCWVRGIHRVCR